jgi:membrane dipeptidase
MFGKLARMATPIVDAHLDLADNVLAGRDYRLDVAAIRAVENRDSLQCTVSLPDLRRGGVALAFATVYTGPDGWTDGGEPRYDSPPWEGAQRQLAVYRGWRDEGLVRLVTTVRELDTHLELWAADTVTGLVILMESADAIEHPRDLPSWWQDGVRLIGPAWSRTRYAGGTHRPGGLTDLGRELVARMAEQGVALDTSHFAEEAFWDALEIGAHAVAASHSNARALVPTDRQLSDDMIKAIGERDGVIGLNLYNQFLHPGWTRQGDHPDVTLADVRAHAEHIARLIGWERVGIGSDLDGGLGLEETPAELDSIADLSLIGEVVPAESRDGVLGENWLRWLRRALPG